MPSLPEFTPGQGVHYTYGGKRHLAEIKSIIPGTDPIKYNIKLTRVLVSEAEAGKGNAHWLPLKSTITTEALQSDMIATS